MSRKSRTTNYNPPAEQSSPTNVGKKLGFMESIKTQPIIYVVWIITISVVMTIYFLVIGFDSKFTIIMGILLFSFLLLNMMLSGMDKIDTYNTELTLYNYVESSAQSYLPFAIALAALVIAASRKDIFVNNKKFLAELLLATCCFVFVLTIVLMPKQTGLPIRISRDIKTAFLTLGGVTIIVLVGEFVLNHRGGNFLENT